jgi:DNA-binding MarR family transcriptional regulator
MVDDTPCACNNLRRAARAITAVYDSALAPVGLRNSQFGVLRRLQRRGPLAVTQLAAEFELDRSTMGRNLDPLERRGLISLKIGDDQRQRVARLTSAGVAAIKSALPRWRAAQARVEATVAPASIDRLADRLAALRADSA